MPESLYLTKSRYMAGLQCERRLWLNVHEPLERPESGLGSTDHLGLEIGRMAQCLFPSGVLVDDPPWEHAKAVECTAALMANRSVPAIFEAAFEHAGVRLRIDVLERLPAGNWRICEVKSSSEVKDHHYDDLALQVYILRSAGVRLSSVQILHVNKDYVRGQSSIEWPKFFRRANVTAEIGRRLDGIKKRLKTQFARLCLSKAPEVEPGDHCHDPISCDHWENCTRNKPADWIFYMPKLNASRRAELDTLGVQSISAIPDDFPLSPRQRIVRDVTRTGMPYVASELARRLKSFGPPAYYLDFEAFLPAVPIYPGTRPYQVIPFQWSLHHVDRNGDVGHQDFLAEADSDPRRDFAQTLIEALKKTKLPIIVYSPYEGARLKELAATFPDLLRAIERIVARLDDLLPIVRDCVYHPGFQFSNSIKTVAPALCPDVTYDDLEDVSDGSGAATAFYLMVSGQAERHAIERLRRSLRDYCKRDTWAMVKLHHALKGLAGRE